MWRELINLQNDVSNCSIVVVWPLQLTRLSNIVQKNGYRASQQQQQTRQSLQFGTLFKSSICSASISRLCVSLSSLSAVPEVVHSPKWPIDLINLPKKVSFSSEAVKCSVNYCVEWNESLEDAPSVHWRQINHHRLVMARLF